MRLTQSQEAVLSSSEMLLDFCCDAQGRTSHNWQHASIARDCMSCSARQGAMTALLYQSKLDQAESAVAVCLAMDAGEDDHDSSAWHASNTLTANPLSLAQSSCLTPCLVIYITKKDGPVSASSALHPARGHLSRCSMHVKSIEGLLGTSGDGFCMMEK